MFNLLQQENQVLQARPCKKKGEKIIKEIDDVLGNAGILPDIYDIEIYC